MRYGALPLVALVLACAGQDRNAADNSAAGAQGNASDAPAGVPVDNGGTAPPPGPATPPNGQPPAGEPEPTSSVTLSASPESVRAGGTVTLRLANGSRQPVGYNLCTSALQTASGAAVQSDRICTMELRTVAPGQSATYAYELPSSLAPGSYRFSTSIEWMAAGNRTSVTSNGIRVNGS